MLAYPEQQFGCDYRSVDKSPINLFCVIYCVLADRESDEDRRKRSVVERRMMRGFHGW